MSTQMQRWRSGSNITSLDMDSQLPSKARPMRLPSASITGEPELPPVMSQLIRKHAGTSPYSLVYWPKSLLRMISLSLAGTRNS